MPDRREGHYWVRQGPDSAPDVAQFVNPHGLGGHWYLPGLEDPTPERYLTILSAEPLEPPK